MSSSAAIAAPPSPVTYGGASLPSFGAGFRWVTSLGLAVVASLCLFWVLYSVIHVTGHGINKIETLPTVDFVRLKHDVEPVQTERRKPPPPPAAKQPPAPAKVQVDVDTSAAAGPPIAVPSSMPGPQIGLAGGGGVGGPAISMDSDLVPLQRMPPQYPAEARRAGIGGKVRVSIHVLADGSVGNVKVLDAKPKGMGFEAASVISVRKGYRFKPKIIAGKPVEYEGTETIEFDIDKAD